MSRVRTERVTITFEVSTNIPSVDLLEFFGSWGQGTFIAMRDAFAETGGAYVLDHVQTIGPKLILRVPAEQSDRTDRRYEALGDAVDDELEKARWEDEQALAQYESEAHLPSYDPEADPYQGETSRRYEEGKQP